MDSRAPACGISVPYKIQISQQLSGQAPPNDEDKKESAKEVCTTRSPSYPARLVRFGVFEADCRLGELTKHGKRIPLQEQPFQVLAMLLKKPGDLVTREELRATLWPQTLVDFDHGVNKAVSKIRDALGDAAENPRFIETVAGRGYRFLADVVVVPDLATDQGVGEPSVATTWLARAAAYSRSLDCTTPRPFRTKAMRGWSKGSVRRRMASASSNIARAPA